MHLGVALKVPTFAIIGGTPASIVAKRSKNFRYLEDPGLKDYPDFTPKMHEISPEMVYWGVKEMLNAPKDAI